MTAPSKKSEIICFCNNIPRDRIEDAVRGGAHTLNEISDQTSAGIGPCGGSCRRKLAPMLEAYLNDGKFPDIIKPDMTGKRKKGSV